MMPRKLSKEDVKRRFRKKYASGLCGLLTRSEEEKKKCIEEAMDVPELMDIADEWAENYMKGITRRSRRARTSARRGA